MEDGQAGVPAETKFYCNNDPSRSHHTACGNETQAESGSGAAAEGAEGAVSSRAVASVSLVLFDEWVKSGDKLYSASFCCQEISISSNVKIAVAIAVREANIFCEVEDQGF